MKKKILLKNLFACLVFIFLAANVNAKEFIIQNDSVDMFIVNGTAGNIILNPYFGNVGIGVTVPKTKLDILGNVSIKGDLGIALPGTVNVSSGNTVINTSADLTANISVNDAIKISNGTAAYDEIFTVSAILAKNITLDSAPTYNMTDANAYKDSNLFLIEDGDGSGKVVVDSSGNVGIGTTTPTEKLNVSGNVGVTGNVIATGNVTLGQKITFAFGEIIDNLVDGFVRITGNLNVTGNITAGTGTVFIDGSNSRVGIGTTSPTSELHVIGSANITGTVYAHNFSGNSNISFLNASGDEVMRITDSGNVGIGTTSPSKKFSVQAGVSDGIALYNSSGGLRGFLGISAPPKDTSAYMTLKNSSGSNTIVLETEDDSYFLGGNVGIGTTSPTAPLNIISTSHPQIVSQGDETYSEFQMVDGQAGGVTFSLNSGYPNAGDFTIRESGVADRFTIKKTTGNVGIGTTNPTSAKLQIYNAETATNLYGVYIDHDETSTTYALWITGDGTYGIGLDANSDDNCYDGDGPGGCSLNDYAEMMEFSELPEDGDVIIIDIENPSELKVSDKPYDKLVAGIASEEPAMVIGSYGITIKGWDKGNITRDGYYTYPLAISGRKRINVNDENGEIMPGDLLVTSSERGKAMKFTLLKFNGDESSQELADKLNENEQRRNSILGKAMTSKGKDNKVLALITLQ